MDLVDPEQDPSLHAAGQLLRRHRPTLTFDERERLERRLAQARSPRPRSRPGSHLATAILLAIGFVLTTTGTGLALSGFASDGSAEQAQYPTQTTGALPSSARGDGAGRLIGIHHLPPPSSLAAIRSAGSESTAELGLSRAITRSDFPLTGFAALPILAVGIVLMISGPIIGTRRGSHRRP